jgi:hypothetical protein
MIIQPIQIVQGNYGYNIPFTLEDGNGNALNLSGATLLLNVQSAQDATQTLLFSHAMSVDSASAGTCHYAVVTGDFPNPGTYLAEIVVTFAAGPVSYPGITIIVNPTLPKTIN